MKRLKVGDKVVAIHSSYVPLGTVGTVLATDVTIFPYKVRFEDYPDIPVWLSASQIEKIPASPTSGRDLRVGDTVRIKSREWYEANKNSCGNIYLLCGFTPQMAQFCGKTFKIAAVIHDDVYKLEGAGGYCFDSSMFDFSDPFSEVADESLASRIKDAAQCVRQMLGKPTVVVSLIKANKLLTNIKVD